MSRPSLFHSIRRNPSSFPQPQKCRLRRSSTLSALTTSLTTRRLPLTYDYLTPTPSHLLSTTLADFLPPPPTSSHQPRSTTLPPIANPAHALPPTHHLIYFPPATPPSSLLPDGTDPLQSPGPPFVRRMWAGGHMLFSPGGGPRLDGTRYVCMEGIRDVQVKGPAGAEKVFVGIERRIGPAPSPSPSPSPSSSSSSGSDEKGSAKSQEDEEEEEQLRTALWPPTASSTTMGATTTLIERRTLVFMRSVPSTSTCPSSSTTITTPPPPDPKILKPTHAPTYTHTLTPTPQLLFRYSALTFNAHLIHLDRSYCREVEGHRNLLVHGPLSVTLMVEVLGGYLRGKYGGAGKGKGEVPRVTEVEYRNLAPLYAGEEMRVCGREVEGGGGEYEVWVEGREGGYAVRGRARASLG